MPTLSSQKHTRTEIIQKTKNVNHTRPILLILAFYPETQQIQPDEKNTWKKNKKEMLLFRHASSLQKKCPQSLLIFILVFLFLLILPP